MNTLSKTITAQWFQSEGDYEALRAWWKAKNTDPNTTVTATDVMLYMTLLGRNWRKAFSPVVRQVELENGRRPYDTAQTAWAEVGLWHKRITDPPHQYADFVGWAYRSRLWQFWQDSPLSEAALIAAFEWIAAPNGVSLPPFAYCIPVISAKVIAEQPVYQEVQVVS